MASNLTEFDYTTALADAWKLAANITVATVTTPQSSPIVKLVCGTDWTGAGASTQGCLTAQYTPGTGLNAQALIALGISDSSTNTNNGFSLNGNLYLPAGGKVGINSQGNENAQFSAGAYRAALVRVVLHFSTLETLIPVRLTVRSRASAWDCLE